MLAVCSKPPVPRFNTSPNEARPRVVVFPMRSELTVRLVTARSVAPKVIVWIVCAVAAKERVIEVVPIAAMVVPAVMPVPDTDCPTANPLMDVTFKVVEAAITNASTKEFALTLSARPAAPMPLNE